MIECVPCTREHIEQLKVTMREADQTEPEVLGFVLLRGSWVTLIFVHPGRPARRR